jgi:ABC-2 type transport system ATP-binding protein
MSAPAAGPVLSVRDLIKSYPPDRTALSGVNLTAAAGEVVGLLGANGAGKTTLVGVCTTRVRATSGGVRLAGLDVSRHASEVKRRIGVVTQHQTLDRSLRVADILYWHCRYFNFSRRRARARAVELLELFDLAGRGREPVFALSGGLARRLQLATAIAHDPQIVFLDEPTTGLDADARSVLWQRIRYLADQGACVLLTTHYLEEADRLSTRLVVLDRGRVIAEGTAAELRDRVGADTLITAQVERPTPLVQDHLARVKGITHVWGNRGELELFARHRDGLISDIATVLLPCGLRDLDVNKPSLEQVTSALQTDDYPSKGETHDHRRRSVRHAYN